MGMGELAQCAILAQVLKLAIPEITMACLLHHAAAGKFAPGWREIPLEQTPTLANRETTVWIQRLKPRVLLFDSAGRAAQLQAAKAVGAHTIFLAGRETSRRKIISLRRLRYLDALWLSQPAAFWRPLPLWKRLLLKCYPKLRVETIGVVFAKADTRQLEPELAAFATAAPYVLMTLGGGGIFSAGIAQNDLAFQAAEECFAKTGVRSILICGPNATALPTSTAACYVLRSVPNAALVALIETSILVLCNGGYTLLQAVALNKATLALALQLLAQAPGPRCTLQSPQRWQEDAAWKLDYSNADRLSADEISRRRAEFDRGKAEAARQRQAAGLPAGQPPC